MAHHRSGRREGLETRGGDRSRLAAVSVILRKELDVSLHAAHLRFHLMIHVFPLANFPLELLYLRPSLVPGCRRALAIALPPLLLAPLGELVLRHGRNFGGRVVVLGLVEERRFLLRRAFGWVVGDRDFALFRDGGSSGGGGHLVIVGKQ